MQDGQIKAAVRCWVENVVVGLELCPFARRELDRGRVRFAVSRARSVEQLLVDLRAELEYLDSHADIETSLLIHPRVLQNFYDYNQFLDTAEGFLETSGWEGIYQVASFHPRYRFAGTRADDVENCTNRSPFPLLHLIREASLERALSGYPDPEQIPVRNIARMNSLGLEYMQALLRACLNADEHQA